MELDTATKLIQGGISENAGYQVWADLGAGTGLFTVALTNILSDGSTVYAVDRDSRSLQKIKIQHKGITLKKISADFSDANFEIEPLDGILMINSLHFIRDKDPLFRQLKSRLKPSGRMVVVEYNTDIPNPWVPYPISLERLERLTEPYFGSIAKMMEIPSSYGRATIYSARLLPVE